MIVRERYHIDPAFAKPRQPVSRKTEIHPRRAAWFLKRWNPFEICEKQIRIRLFETWNNSPWISCKHHIPGNADLQTIGLHPRNKQSVSRTTTSQLSQWHNLREPTEMMQHQILRIHFAQWRSILPQRGNMKSKVNRNSSIHDLRSDHRIRRKGRQLSTKTARITPDQRQSHSPPSVNQ